MDNRFNPVELYPRARAWIVREQGGRRGIDVGTWDVLGSQAKWPMTNVRQLGLPQWRRLAADPGNRCLIPLTEFAEWTPDTHAVGGGKPIKGEMWFACTDQPIFAVAGFAQQIGDQLCWAMVTCDPNPLVAPFHPKAMITILDESDWDQWLCGSYDEAVILHRPVIVDGPLRRR
ncbi:SOS response-associated peptidase family protein [Sphingomonas solaris]|uniref:SOS response-associated peptidase family protein n=1 Tax=Alterirhizorhabdus solaris TaxID=2529389 RepID=UPI0019394247|nr:SOS response-associated peptidase family protein [Sphingomonas solaris]